MTIIEQLNKLAEKAPDICQITHQSESGAHYTIGEYTFFQHRIYGFIANLDSTASSVTGRPALAWLEGALRQVIEARGWEYTLCKFSHNYFIEIWSDEVVFESQATSAAEALLAALIAAMEGEDG